MNDLVEALGDADWKTRLQASETLFARGVEALETILCQDTDAGLLSRARFALRNQTSLKNASLRHGVGVRPPIVAR